MLLFVIGFFIQSFGQSQPSFLETQQFWQSEEFINKFMATYGVKSEVEPKINAEEKKLFNDLIPVIQQDPDMAISILQGRINAQSSAALEFTLGNLYAQTSNNLKAVNQYRAAIKKFPDFQRAHMNLGICLLYTSPSPRD